MANEMTNQQATDEALLLFIRKMRRLHPDAFGDVWNRIPDDAKTALMIAECRADKQRTEAGGAPCLVWPSEPYGPGTND